jgi:hypothetical protein
MADGHYSLKYPCWVDTDGYTDRDRQMFICGIEYYMLALELEGPGEVKRYIHAENASRVRLLAGKIGRTPISIEPCNHDHFPGWWYVTAPAKKGADDGG